MSCSMRRNWVGLAVLAMLAACGGESVGASGSSSPPTAVPSAPAVPPVATPAPPPAAPGPEAVARDYLERGTREADVRDLVDPACHEHRDTMSVDAVRMFGTPVRGGSVEVETPSIEAERATVRFTVTGSLSAANTETKVGGAQVRIGGLQASGTRLSGTVRLARVDGSWKITCNAGR